MSNAKHTPGPSEAGASGDVVCELCRDFGFIMLLGDDGKETAPVTCYCHKALPDLLAACKEALRWFKLLDKHGPKRMSTGEFWEVTDALFVAIAKAEGRR